MTMRDDHGTYSEEPVPAGRGVARDPVLSIHRGQRRRLLRIPDVKIRTGLIPSALIMAAAIIVGCAAIVLVGFAAHAIWDAVALGWRLADG